ncbi:hypothetical protein JCM8208_004413 [Rhodotorula glutinis]
MVPYIPLELVHLIASAALVLGDDPSKEERRARFALAKNLSLVCRAWRHVGQAALFRAVELYVGQKDGFLRERQRSHLFSHVHELVVLGSSSSAKMDQNIARCRRECDQLRRLCLDNPLAWSVWFGRTPRPVPVVSVTEFSISGACIGEKRVPDLVRVLQGASLLPSVTKFAVELKAASDPGLALPDLVGSSPWVKVRDLAVSTDQRVGQLWTTFLRELPNLFLLDRLASLALDQGHKNDLDSHLSLLQQTTSLRRLALGFPTRELSRVAIALAPILSTMAALRIFTLRALYWPSTRNGGSEIFPVSLLAYLPRTLVAVDVDLCIDSASLSAEQAFLEDRLDSSLERWTTSSSSLVSRWTSAHGYIPVRWIKGRDERDGTSAWEREEA